MPNQNAKQKFHGKNTDALATAMRAVFEETQGGLDHSTPEKTDSEVQSASQDAGEVGS